jgi:hypothetical protein
VPGSVATVPPTAKLPCSWITSGSGLLTSSAMTLVDARILADISNDTAKGFHELIAVYSSFFTNRE